MKAEKLAPYVTRFHLREHTASALELLNACEWLIQHGISPEQIIVNDRADVAEIAAVKGVQLAWHSLPVERVKRTFKQLVVGKSVHSIEEAEQAERMGCDYLLFGHIYSTNSKPGLPPRGLAALEQIVNSVQLPVIAIGGIRPHHVASIANTGAAGIAVMSGILAAPDSVNAALQYIHAIHRI